MQQIALGLVERLEGLDGDLSFLSHLHLFLACFHIAEDLCGGFAHARWLVRTQGGWRSRGLLSPVGKHLGHGGRHRWATHRGGELADGPRYAGEHTAEEAGTAAAAQGLGNRAQTVSAGLPCIGERGKGRCWIEKSRC